MVSAVCHIEQGYREHYLKMHSSSDRQFTIEHHLVCIVLYSEVVCCTNLEFSSSNEVRQLFYNKIHTLTYTVTSLTALPITVCRNVLISCCHQCRICVIDDLRLIIFLNVIAPMPVMCSLMLLCQCCFATVELLLKKVTYLLTL